MKVTINTEKFGKIVLEDVRKIMSYPVYLYFSTTFTDSTIDQLYKLFQKNGIPRSEVIDIFVENI